MTNKEDAIGTYRNLSSAWDWERINGIYYATNLVTGEKVVFETSIELVKYADTGRKD